METFDQCVWSVAADPEAAVAHALPHRVVSQLLRPELAAAVPAGSVRIPSLKDARDCVSAAAFNHRRSQDVCSLSAPDLDFPAQFPLLTALDLSNTDVDPAFLAEAARRLRALDLSGCDAVDPRPLSEHFPHLRSLNVAFCGWLNADTLTHLSTFQQLRDLDISYCKGGVDAVSKLTQLTRLNVGMCAIDDAAMVHIEKLASLEALYLFSPAAGLTAAGLAHLRCCRGLRELSLAGYAGFDEAAAAVVGTLTGLRVLNLGSTPANATSLEIIAGALLGLEKLFLYQCPHVDSVALQHVAKLTQLRVLHLYGCDGVDAAGLAHLAVLRRLWELHVADCGGDVTLEDAALEPVRFVPELVVS